MATSVKTSKTKNSQNASPEVKAILRYEKITPRKMRLVADLIRGLPVSEAEAQLYLSPRKASEPLLKLLRSAIANAENNFKLNRNKLFVKSIQVNQGPRFKRYMMRARGAVSPIHKIMSHVVIVLAERDEAVKKKFVLPERKLKPAKQGKKSKPAEKEKEKTEKKPELDAPAPKPTKGVFKKIFRRKSI